MRLISDRKTAVINVIAAIALALLLETSVWLGLKHPRLVPGFLLPYFQGYYLSQDRQIIQVSDCGIYDQELFYLLKKGHCSFVNREFEVVNEINSAGLRDDEASLHSPSIIVFGDSFTLGWGVDQQKSYPALLEQLVQVKVLNAGMSSFGTARELLMKNRLDLAKATKIIIQYHPNDYEENKKFIDEDFTLPVRSNYSYDSLKKAIGGRRTYYPLKHLAGVAKAFAHSAIDKQIAGVNDTLQALAFLQIVAQANLLESQREIIVFGIDKKGNTTEPFENALRHFLSTSEFQHLPMRVLNITSILDKNDYFLLDDHINETGHLKIARALHQFLIHEPLPVMVNDLSVE